MQYGFLLDSCDVILLCIVSQISNKSQFFQALHDNLLQRFPCSDILASARVLNKLSWPKDPLQKALFGDSELSLLCKQFGVDSSTSAQVVFEYALFKKNEVVGPHLQKFISMLEVLPISSAECERGFSQMNLNHTSQRNRLLTSTVSDLLMVGVNGPPIHTWNASKYVVSWLQSGRHGALDKATGLPKQAVTVKQSSKLFD